MTAKSVEVEKLYTRDKDLKRDDVRIIQEWLKKEPHLPEMEEYQIIAFLHSCFYKTELTKLTIDKYFTMRTHHPETFSCLSEDRLRSCMKVVFVGILPDRTPEGYTVLLVKLLDYNADVYHFSQLVSLINMILTLYMHQNGFATGGIVVFESRGFSFAHVTKTSLSVLKCALEHVQEGAPVRIKGIHFINIVPAMEKFKLAVKPFLKSSLYNMIKFHPSGETVYKDIPHEHFPEEYGGKAPSIKVLQEENLKNLVENYEFFHWHDSQRVDETNRIEESRGPAYGINGTFKKIEID